MFNESHFTPQLLSCVHAPPTPPAPDFLCVYIRPPTFTTGIARINCVISHCLTLAAGRTRATHPRSENRANSCASLVESTQILALTPQSRRVPLICIEADRSQSQCVQYCIDAWGGATQAPTHPSTWHSAPRNACDFWIVTRSTLLALVHDMHRTCSSSPQLRPKATSLALGTTVVVLGGEQKDHVFMHALLQSLVAPPSLASNRNIRLAPAVVVKLDAQALPASPATWIGANIRVHNFALSPSEARWWRAVRQHLGSEPRSAGTRMVCNGADRGRYFSPGGAQRATADYLFMQTPAQLPATLDAAQTEAAKLPNEQGPSGEDGERVHTHLELLAPTLVHNRPLVEKHNCMICWADSHALLETACHHFICCICWQRLVHVAHANSRPANCPMCRQHVAHQVEVSLCARSFLFDANMHTLLPLDQLPAPDHAGRMQWATLTPTPCPQAWTHHHQLKGPALGRSRLRAVATWVQQTLAQSPDGLVLLLGHSVNDHLAIELYTIALQGASPGRVCVLDLFDFEALIWHDWQIQETAVAVGWLGQVCERTRAMLQTWKSAPQLTHTQFSNREVSAVLQ